MRDPEQFERLLDAVLRGCPPPPEAWSPFRDRMAVLITDLSGFTRITRELGIERMVALLHGMRRIALPILASHGGVLVKYQADDLFAAFPTAPDALRCALDLLRAFETPDPPLPAEIRLCMGIGCGDILWWGDHDLYGEEVNLASKLGEDTAGACQILLTDSAAQEVKAAHGQVRLSSCPPLNVGGRAYAYFSYEGGF